MAVTPADIATALGVANPETESLTYAQWVMWIADAEMLIEQRRVKVGADPIPTTQLDYVVREAVSAHVKRPDNATTVTIAVDDGSSSRRYESGTGRVAVDQWWTYLGLEDTTSEAFTIRPAGIPIAPEDIGW